MSTSTRVTRRPDRRQDMALRLYEDQHPYHVLTCVEEDHGPRSRLRLQPQPQPSLQLRNPSPAPTLIPYLVEDQ